MERVIRSTAEARRAIWPAHPRQLAPMRLELRRWLAPLAMTGETQEDMILAANEAAANSVEHAYPDATEDDTVDAGAAAITLTNAGNNFIGAVNLRGGTTQIIDANDLTLGTAPAQGGRPKWANHTVMFRDDAEAYKHYVNANWEGITSRMLADVQIYAR